MDWKRKLEDFTTQGRMTLGQQPYSINTRFTNAREASWRSRAGFSMLPQTKGSNLTSQRMMSWWAKPLGIGGMQMTRRTAARFGAGGALGLFALNKMAATWDSARYRDPIGTAWNAALTAGAGYASYAMFQHSGAIRKAGVQWMEMQATKGKMIPNMISKMSKFTGRIR